MQLQTAQAAATQEIDRLNVIRQAAGVADRVARPAPGRHYGRWVCTDCRREGRIPPYLPFGLNTHRRAHERRYPDHKILYYCFDHCAFEDDWDIPGLPVQPWELTEPQQDIGYAQQTPSATAVVHALEVLKAAGYPIGALADPEIPALLPPLEPPKLSLTWGEAETLKLVRAQPGILSREVADIRGLTRSTITSYLVLLHKGGHVRLEMGRWYPVGDRPIGKVEPRGKVRWSPRPIAEIRPLPVCFVTSQKGWPLPLTSPRLLQTDREQRQTHISGSVLEGVTRP